MPVSPCICCDGCCECPPELPTSYSVDASGTWDLSFCNNFRTTGWCDSAGTTLVLPQFTACEFGNDGPGFGEYCLDEYALSRVVLGLICNSAFGNRWVLDLVFFDIPNPEDPIPVTAGVQLFYKQRTRNCDDPSGIYDLIHAACSPWTGGPLSINPSIICPSTITVS